MARKTVDMMLVLIVVIAIVVGSAMGAIAAELLPTWLAKHHISS